MKKPKIVNKNYKFIDSAILNDATYMDYLDRFKKIALSMFEWVNLPKSMNARWLEMCLYYKGQASLLKDKKYGFINTNCCSNGQINIYGLPTQLNCYSFEYQDSRKLYTGLNPTLDEKQQEEENYKQAVLVQNNWESIPTCGSMELFAYRLYEAQRTCDTNIKSQKFPIMVVVNEKQRLMMENLYNQYDGNQPFIFGDNDQLNENILKAINTEAPYIADKLTEYKKEIWNEALTFLGINNIAVSKKERLITGEANENNELINLNLQSYLAPRLEACRQFNEMFGLTGTDKEISVRVRSDLENIIKQEMSIVTDFNKDGKIDKEDEKIKDVIENE